MSAPYYRAERVTLLLEGKESKPGQRVDAAAFQRLKKVTQRALLDAGKVVLVVEGEPMAATAAAAAINVRA